MLDEVRRDLDLVLCALGQPSSWEHLSLTGDNNNVEGEEEPSIEHFFHSGYS